MRRTVVHHEVRPSRHPPARSPRRVRARRCGQFAFKMRFHIAKFPINRYWFNRDQVSFWFEVPKETQIHHIALSANVTFRLDLTLSRTRQPQPKKCISAQRDMMYLKGGLFCF